MIFEDLLKRSADLHPDKPAIVCKDSTCTYAQLYGQARQRAARFHILTDRAVALRAQPGIDFIIDYLAVHIAGKVAVPLDKDLNDEMFSKFKQSLAGKKVPEGSADILFTTGTTGKSKGVIISHEAIIADAENLAEAQGYTDRTAFIICGPLNHIGSLSKLYPSLLAGATVYLLEGLKDMDAFFKTVSRASGTIASFMVPASLKMLLTFCRDRLEAYADKIDFIETGAAPISQTDMEALCNLSPHTRLFNTYASTETGIISTFNFNAGECVAGCLGKPMRHSDFCISEQGTVVCSGKTLMTGYFEDDGMTRQILHDGKVHTSDLGRIDSLGRLHLTGRNDDIINIGGYKVSPVEVEQEALKYPGISDCICIASVHRVLGNILKLIIVTEKPTDLRDLSRFLKQRLESHKVPKIIEEADCIRRTFNGKLDRKSYKDTGGKAE